MTYQMIAAQIAERYGPDEVENYDPYSNCLTIRQWNKLGYRVKKGEQSLQSVTFVEHKDKDGNIVKKYPKTINLFYELQVEKANY